MGKYRSRTKPKITKNQKDSIWKNLNLMTLSPSLLTKIREDFLFGFYLLN
jgi:hypothetical protein